MKVLANEAGLILGGTVEGGVLDGGSYEAIVEREIGMAEIGVDALQKFLGNTWANDPTIPPVITWNTTNTDTTRNWANARDLKLSTLAGLWFINQADFMANVTTEPAGRAHMEAYIGQLCGMYAGEVFYHQIVNEAVEPGSPDSLKLRQDGGNPSIDHPWYRLLGQNYIRDALIHAHSIDPDAKLLINDFGLFESGGDGTYTAKRDAYLALIDNLQANGAPLHLLGIQSHLTRLRPEIGAASWPDDGSYGFFNPERFIAFLEAVQAKGLDIYLTEMDCNDLAFTDETPVDERRQWRYEMTKTYLDAAFSVRGVIGLNLAAISDSSTYFDTFPTETKLHSDQPEAHPWNRSFETTPMYDALVEALKARAPANAQASPQPYGTVEVGRQVREGVSLRAEAFSKGITFGNAIGQPTLSDTSYMDLVVRECRALVCENEHKMYTIAPTSGPYDFTGADAIATFATNNGLKLRGHAVVWPRDIYTPAWVQALNAADTEAFLEDYVTTVIARYPQIDSWDVVNEAVDDTTGLARVNHFDAVTDYVKKSFDWARAAAPHAQLVYNDYMGPQAGSLHLNGVVTFLDNLLTAGAPIDALGIQSHLGWHPHGGSSYGTMSVATWQSFLDDIVALGLDILITELDVSDANLTLSQPAWDEEQARWVEEYLDITLAYSQCKNVFCWGLADNHTWLSTARPRPPPSPANDTRPTPYDTSLTPKPIREAIWRSFNKAAVR